ncbi:MAG TPA: hypothetical protein VGK45_11570, partial [Thermoanaerobaculia bacterium]
MEEQGAQGDRGGAAADEEIAAARRLIHELPSGAADRPVLFRFYVAGEEAESLRAALHLDAAAYDRIHARALQRYKEILRTAKGTQEKDEITDVLRRGLTGLAAREAAGEVVERRGLLARLGSPAGAEALIVLGLVALLAAGLLELRAHRLRLALDAMHATSPARSLEPAEVLQAQLQEARRALDEERLRAAERIAKERRQRDDLHDELERMRRPQTNTPILHLEHDPPSARTTPRHHITQPAVPGWMVLSLDLEGVPTAPSYGVTLLTPGGSTLWTSAGLIANPWRSLVITFPSTLLKPGDYRLQVDATPLKGAPA